MGVSFLVSEGFDMADQVLGVEADITFSDGINKAFVVNEGDLKHFFAMGKEWVEGDEVGETTVRCKALLKNTKEALVSDSIDTILEYSNPSKQEICNIFLQMCCKEKGKIFEVDFQSFEYPNLIQVTVGSTSVQTEKLFLRLMAELNETTQWYWFLACRRWLLKIATWAFWVFLVLTVCYGSLSVVGTAYRNRQIRKQYKEWLRRNPPIAQEPGTTGIGEEKSVVTIKKTQPKVERVNPAIQVWDCVRSRQFLAGMGIIIGGVFLVRITIYLFPKAVFEIGKGKQRHERLRAMRKWFAGILTAIIVAGIIVPIMKEFVTKLFENN